MYLVPFVKRPSDLNGCTWLPVQDQQDVSVFLPTMLTYSYPILTYHYLFRPF